MKTIREIDVEGKIILLRADFNVPVKDGEITSDFRIRAVQPTIQYLQENGARKIIIMSHFGRPKGADAAYSMKKVAEKFSEIICEADFVPAMRGDKVKAAVKNLRNGGILILENLRFDDGEKGNDETFIREILDETGAEVYVQDAFAVLHREHASVVAVKKVAAELKIPVVMGLLVEKEVENLSKIIENPDRPMVLVIGGAKVEDKEPLIEKFSKIANKIVVGGKIAADGYKTTLQNIYVAEDFDLDGEGRPMDVGPVSMAKIASDITDAATVVWNGLLGKAEDPAYATASTIVAEMMGEKYSATTIVCGGDTTGFVEELMLEHPSLDYTLLSTGGGAALEFLLRGTLAGLE